jgi:hypothetical protein
LISGFGNKYVPQVLKPIDLSKQNHVIECNFINKYNGKYNIGLYVQKPIFHLDKYETEFQLEIKVYKDEEVIFSESVSDSVFNFTGWENGRDGMALVVYRSPKDLPLKYPLKCVVEIIKPDMHFEKKYGVTQFYIRKMSDK